ncbi:hypothetical protein Tco_1124682 [Tanacetum coccineum]|uniref:Uncharacterized protein n=1 Tax=Tanacetum coccineum TaxID=301880 RepID=A0ABQ5J9L7_9ASTR
MDWEFVMIEGSRLKQMDAPHGLEPSSPAINSGALGVEVRLTVEIVGVPQTYSCELCGNDSHEENTIPLNEPCYNQNFGDYYYPQNSPSFQQQYLCCENYGGPHADFQCQPRNQNFYEPNLCYNSNSSDFDLPPQYSIDHQPQSIQEDLNQQRMNDVHNKWIILHNDMIESRNELLKTMQYVVEMLGQREQAANLSTHTPEPSRHFKSICYDDDDDEERRVEDTSNSDKECDLPFCDNYVTFSNPLFDANDDFTSSNKGVPKENVKIYSNPLFDFDDKYISSDVNPLFNERRIIDDIDVSTDIDDGYHDSEGDIIYLESLLFNDTILNLPPEVFLDHDPRSLNDEPNIDDLKIKKNVRFTFEDRHYLSLTFVIKIFLLFLTYLVNSLLLLSSGSEDTVFDPGISAFCFYS